MGVDSGGGGYGSPLDRDPEMVRADVLEGMVSPEKARQIYGVIFKGHAGGRVARHRSRGHHKMARRAERKIRRLNRFVTGGIGKQERLNGYSTKTRGRGERAAL